MRGVNARTDKARHLLRPTPGQLGMAIDLDCTVARLQLEELELRSQALADGGLALQLLLQEQLGTDSAPQTDDILQSLLDASEEQQLQEQITSLSQFIAVAEGQQTALDSVAEEEAQQAASLQLATALQAQEEWDATVLRPHDAALARAIADCSTDWEELGQGLQNPLDLTGRPTEPQDPGSAHSATAAAHSPHSVLPVPEDIGSCSKHTATTSGAPPATYGHGGGSSAATGFALQGSIQCGICFESFPADGMFSATLPAELASSSRAAGRCSHKYCSTCMQQYLVCEVQAHKIPIYCPDPGCDEQLAASDVLHLLADNPQLVQVYHAVEAEQLIDTARRVYCPYKDCSMLLERPEQGGQGEGQEAPFECPVCHRSFCLSCNIAGWHAGMSCQGFQDLPADLKSAEDAAMLHIAKQKQWKRCPACGHLVERTVGCNHMVCRCGCDFCYACGTKYTSKQPSANNVHGTQACGCDLFQVPDEAARAPAPAPVVLHQAHGGRRPWRNGRHVSRTRCRHAASIYDCPHGPERCWFWHDEDGDPDSD